MRVDAEPTVEGAISRSVRMLREITLISLVSFFSFAISAIAGLYIARTLEPLHYGRVAYFSSIFTFAILLAGIGLTTKVTSDLSRAVRTRTELNKSFYTLLSVRIATLLPLLIICFTLAHVFDEDLYFYAGLCAALFILSDFLTGVLQGLQRIASVAQLLFIQPCVYLGLLIAGAVQQVEWIFIALAGSYAVSTPLACFNIVRSGRLNRPYKQALSLTYARRSLIPSIQIYVIVLLQITYATYTIMLLGATTHFLQAAELSVPLTLVRILPLTLGPVLSTVLYPRLCAFYAGKDSRAAAHTLALFYNAFAVIALCVVSILTVYPDFVITLLYTSKYLSSAPLLSMLAPLSLLLLMESQITLTLIAAGSALRALLALAVRLILLILGATALVTLGLSNQAALLAGVYVVSALVGLAVELRQLQVICGYSPPIIRTIAAGAGAIAIAFLLRQLPDLPEVLVSEGYRAFLSVVLTLCLAGWLLLRTEILAYGLAVQRFLTRTIRRPETE